MKNAIEIKNLSKKYDNFELNSINLDIPSGLIIGLIGENGAGKTTLIKSILNIVTTNSGTVKIFNQELKKSESIIKEDIGVVLDNIFFPEILTPADIDKIMTNIYKKWDKSLFKNYMMSFNLPVNKQIKTMSKGMRKKLEIATALSHHPKLLILDEPTSGLDPVVRNEVLEIFLKFIEDDDHTILFSTHITTDLEHIADYIIFMDSGKIVLNKTRDDIIDNYGILKCEHNAFKSIQKEDIVRYKKSKYNYEILIDNKDKIKKKYKNYIVDNITLDDLMILMIKGER